MRRCLSFFGVVFLFSLSDSVFAVVAFTLRAEDLPTGAKAVCVVGSFNDWNIGGNPMVMRANAWRASITLPDGRHEYKFVWTDEKGKVHWVTDRRHPYQTDNGICGANSVVDVAGGVAITPTEDMVHFVFWHPTAKWVAVAGDFNDWYLGQFLLLPSRDYHGPNQGKWELWLPLKRPFSYKFICDGVWTPDLTGRWEKVPDGFGHFNSFRPADTVTSPAAVTLSETVRSGDASMLEGIFRYNEAADYGRTVRLARAVAAANERTEGVDSSLRLRALDLEAKAHKRWARLPDAVRCWEQIAAVDRDTTETRRAIWELAAYYTHVERNTEAARRACELAMQRISGDVDFVKIVVRHVEATYKERRDDEVAVETQMWLSALPPPEGREKEYACQLSELWLYKAHAHLHLKQWVLARQACQTLIAMHPYPESQNVKRARSLLREIAYGEKTSQAGQE